MAKSDRKVKTQQFGVLTISQDDVFMFNGSIIGYELQNEFILLSEKDILPFKWLISMDDSETSFLLIEPGFLNIKYDRLKEVANGEQVYCIVTVDKNEGIMSVNLKAPLILNQLNHVGRQIILSAEIYSTNHIIDIL